MTIREFEQNFENYSFDFSKPIRSQERICDKAFLRAVPDELSPSYAYRSGGRGRPNRNQTRTHSQCATCHRVLRNDYFYTPPSMVKKNIIYSHCRECAQKLNSENYSEESKTMRNSKLIAWSYLAPFCALCSFSQHISAMDLHHPKSETEEQKIHSMIADFIQDLNPHKGELLLRTAQKCVPLCSNCHRMVEANAIQVPSNVKLPDYRLDTLLSLLNA